MRASSRFDGFNSPRDRPLAESAAFTPLATNLPGQVGTSTYIVSNAVGAGPFSYRLGVGG